MRWGRVLSDVCVLAILLMPFFLQVDMNGRSALSLAATSCSASSLHICRMLLAAGADWMSTCSQGERHPDFLFDSPEDSSTSFVCSLHPSALCSGHCTTVLSYHRFGVRCASSHSSHRQAPQGTFFRLGDIGSPLIFSLNHRHLQSTMHWLVAPIS